MQRWDLTKAETPNIEGECHERQKVPGTKVQCYPLKVRRDDGAVECDDKEVEELDESAKRLPCPMPVHGIFRILLHEL